MSQLLDGRTTESQSCETISSEAEVDGISLSVRKGSCFGLLGPNGAVKTITVEIMEGIKIPPVAPSCLKVCHSEPVGLRRFANEGKTV